MELWHKLDAAVCRGKVKECFLVLTEEEKLSQGEDELRPWIGTYARRRTLAGLGVIHLEGVE